MEAVVLAGGLGTRLREAVPEWPKPMAPVAGRPFLEILLSDLAKKGFRRVVLSVGYMAEKIQIHFQQRFAGMDLVYAVESTPLGTGGGVRLALTMCKADFVFVFNGDTYLDLEVGDVADHWRTHHHPIIIGREVADTARYGRLMTSSGLVTGFSEKSISGPGIINAGCYVLEKSALDAFPPNTPFSMETDYLVPLVAKEVVDVFVTSGKFIDIGIPEDFQRAQDELSEVHR
jgi:D-glycero-alpha-D-manno-heptose 1-phosphate guanylyltransferase